MRYRLATFPVVPATVGVLLLAGVAGGAVAQQAAPLEGIVVTAERMLSVERPAGVVDQEFRVKATVYYSDLDLKTKAGKEELEARVSRVASEVCTELDKILPARTLEHGNCVRDSVGRAMAEVAGR